MSYVHNKEKQKGCIPNIRMHLLYSFNFCKPKCTKMTQNPCKKKSVLRHKFVYSLLKGRDMLKHQLLDVDLLNIIVNQLCFVL